MMRDISKQLLVIIVRDESLVCLIDNKTFHVSALPIRLVLAFSIPRNWYRLYATPKTHEARSFRYIQGLRSTTTYLVVQGHVYFTSSICPVANTEFIEEMYYHISDTFILSGMNIVQTFFAISGFLMGMQFFELTKRRKFNFNYFWEAIVYRYIRLTPIYAMIIFFEATWQYKLGEGPLWKRISGGEKVLFHSFLSEATVLIS